MILTKDKKTKKSKVKHLFYFHLQIFIHVVKIVRTANLVLRFLFEERPWERG